MEEKKNEETEIKEEKIFVDNKEDDVNPKDIRAFTPGKFYFPGQIISKEETIDKINQSRAGFYLFVDRSDKIKKIVLFSFLGLFALFAILLLIKPDLVNQLFSVMIILFVVFLIASYFLVIANKKKKNISFDQYRYDYCLLFDTYVFYQTGISNLEFSYNTKIDEDEVKKISCYENIIATPTRDIIKGSMFGVNFNCYDLLIRTETNANDKKTQSVVFSGKMFHFDLNTKVNQKLYLYLKGCGDSQPNELKGMDKVSVSGLKKDYLVYSSFDNVANLLNKNTLDVLNKIVIDDVIEDVIISISGEGVYIGLSLTSEYMTIPFKNDVDDKFISHFKNDVELVKTLVASLLSNKNYEKKVVEENN